MAANQLDTSTVQFPSGDATIKGFVARPTGAGPWPGVVVIHENKGLVEHIKDVTRRVAREGYVALGVDLLSREGGTEKYADPITEVPGVLSGISGERHLGDMRAAVDFLSRQSYVRADRLGVVGFCFGGAQSLALGCAEPRIKATVVFYGRNPDPVDKVQGLNGPLLGIYGELDANINPGIPALLDALLRHKKRHSIHIYPDAQHAFFNDTTPERHSPEASADAWPKVVAFFNKHLKG